jgi:uncharacterized protein
MMKKILFLLASFFLLNNLWAQKNDSYAKEIKAYQQNYVAQHEVVPEKDKKYFRFFPVNKMYRVHCHFERINDSVGFNMTTSAKTQKHYYKYGRLDFMIEGKEYLLFVYQSKDLMQTEEYRDYLFVPFTDETTGDESYGSGRYLELSIKEISGNSVELDFNKAYNPYCAFSPDYKCPIPPRENRLPVAIRAGEKNFAKGH